MIGTPFLAVILLAAVLSVLIIIMLIKRRKRYSAMKKKSFRGGVYISKNGADADSGHLGGNTGDFFQGMSREGYETVCMSQELREQTFGEKRRQVKLISVKDGAAYHTVFSSGLFIGRTKIGAEGYPCLLLPYSSVSGIHCHIYGYGRGVYVKDKGSTNHTYVNGRQIESAYLIRSGDILKMGREEFKIEIR